MDLYKGTPGILVSTAASAFKARHATKTSMRNLRLSEAATESNFLSRNAHARGSDPVIDTAARGQIGAADRRTGSQLRSAAERRTDEN